MSRAIITNAAITTANTTSSSSGNTSTNTNNSILDRPLGRMASRVSSSTSNVSSPSMMGYDSNVVSLSAFAYLFSEIVQYHQNRVDSISELERRLEGTGYTVGLRVLELLAYRAKDYKRETRLMNLLQFISTTVWKSLFGKVADSLERSIDHADEFMIVDYTPITSTYVSVPADFGGLSVDSYISGIIAGILEGAAFPARVTAHNVTLEDGEVIPNNPSSSSSTAGSNFIYQASYSTSELTGIPLLPPRKEKAVFLVKFAPSVLQRDSNMG